ncbi:MAG TPA: hypothetical protein PKC30_11870 [Saprospiraceae bacterium]|nr:hypothetical protein [Saprospiraceae bacterium]
MKNKSINLYGISLLSLSSLLPVFMIRIFMFCFAIAIVCSAMQCEECSSSMVKIKKHDKTPPDLVIDIETSETGEVVRSYYEEKTVIEVGLYESVNIRIRAKDNESGIKDLSIEGSFSIVCTNAGLGEPMEGTIHGSAEFDPATSRCAPERAITTDLKIDASEFCNGQVKEGFYTIVGQSINYAGKSSSIFLEVIFR